MDDESDALELGVMLREYEWLLHEEVKRVLTDLKEIFTDALKVFNFDSGQHSESQAKPEKFLLLCPNGVNQSKCMVTLTGDLILEADLGIRLQKQPVIIYQTRIYPEFPWRLQQIQDAGNHLRCALSSINDHIFTSSPSAPSLSSASRVLSFVDDLICFLKLGRERICLPKAQPINDLIKSSNNKSFKPSLPQDTVAAFYIQAQKLILAVHHIGSNSQNKTEMAGNRYQLECSVPWLNDALLVFTVALNKCQQLKDKVVMFANYQTRLLELQPSHQHLSKSCRPVDSSNTSSRHETLATETGCVSCSEPNTAEMTCL